MKRKHGTDLFSAPFLRSLTLRDDKAQGHTYPWTVPLFRPDFKLEFTRPVTIIMGQNGSGKSTLLEAIAGLCGFAQRGGNRNHALLTTDTHHDLTDAFRAAWKPKVNTGFFVRAETMANFISTIDDIAATSGMVGSTYAPYGGKSLGQRSHGEAFMAIFANQIQRRGVFILDEPEAALSPARQLEFIKLLHKQATAGQTQFIIATHSPLLMAYPDATLLEIDDDKLVERNFKATDHFRLLHEFYTDPDVFMDALL